MPSASSTPSARRRASARHGRRWAKAEIIERARVFHERHGRGPEPADWATPGDHPGVQTVKRQFGGFTRLRVEAGLEGRALEVRSWGTVGDVIVAARLRAGSASMLELRERARVVIEGEPTREQLVELAACVIDLDA
jgi:hypothetical protein